MDNEFAKKVLKATRESFNKINMLDAMDYAMKCVEDIILVDAKKGETYTCITPQTIYKHATEYMKENGITGYPNYYDVQDFIMYYINRYLCDSKSFIKKSAFGENNGLPVIEYDYENHSELVYTFTWGNMF